MKVAVFFWVVDCVEWYEFTNISEVCTASITHHPDDGGSTDLGNNGKHRPVNMAL
jgi:hypothetical protein